MSAPAQSRHGNGFEGERGGRRGARGGFRSKGGRGLRGVCLWGSCVANGRRSWMQHKPMNKI
eukprot:320362-Prorocentrum_minimum.AAC.1